MDDTLDLLLLKMNPEKKWLLQAKHPGQVHVDMETAGKASRWNTLHAMRVIRHFGLGSLEYKSLKNK